MRKDQFINRHAHLGIPQSELDRKWRVLQEEQEMMQLMEAARQGQSSAAVSAGGGGTPLEVGSGWSLLVDGDDESGAYSYPQSATTDASGNVYTLSLMDWEGPPTSILRKLTPEGEMVWEVALQSSATECNVEPNRLEFGPDGFLYSLHQAGIRKTDPADGSEVWSWLLNTEEVNFRFVSIGFRPGGGLVTLGTYYGEIASYILATWVEDTESNTLIKQTEQEFWISGTMVEYVNAAIKVNSDDTVYLPLNYALPLGEYGTLLVKWDLGEDALVWQYNIWEGYFGGEDQDCTAMGVDSHGNVYVDGYGSGLTKITSEGSLAWSLYFEDNRYYGLAVSPAGDCYLYGNPYDFLQIVKFSTDGVLQWSNLISNDSLGAFDDAGWWNDACSMAQDGSGSFLFMAKYSYDGGPYKEMILRTNGELITGTYDYMTFTDNTSEVNPVPANPLNDSLTLNWNSTSYLTQAPAGFEPAYIVQEKTLTKIG